MDTTSQPIKEPTIMVPNQIVSQDEWLVARKQLLMKEKELTRLRDQLSTERRALPWVKIEKTYVFEGPNGKESLSDLFDGKSQLIIQHFMLGPGWKEGCIGCSFQADHLEGALLHLQHRDVAFAAVSRAPVSEIEAFKKRMGWRFKWLSSYESDFNYDFHVSFPQEAISKDKVYYNYDLREFQSEELSGTSVFYQEETGRVFHTYSTYARGDEPLLGTYNYLDLTPKGRGENGPNFNLTDWVRHHDNYLAAGTVASNGQWRPSNDSGSCCH
jgi:predicted dithiol-disulfide oxidoreductase (DUF899 family)